MYYYEVLVSSPRYHGENALTYEFSELLKEGVVVIVALQRQNVLGVIKKAVDKPGFATKPIIQVVDKDGVPSQLLQLVDWLKDYYPAPLGQLIGMFLPASLSQIRKRSPKIEIDIKKTQKQPSKFNLTSDQQKAIKAILANKSRATLLHGDTATGKTQVYIEVAQKIVESGRSIIVLTPEIGLTSQLVNSFSQQFPGYVYLLHSNLTPAERRKAWQAVASSKSPIVVIGPRSALFSPLKNVGLIVLDEAHDSAYKQEQAPYYQATRVAAKLSDLHQAQLILGSATPLISDYYTFKSKDLAIIRMKQIATETIANNADVKVVNLRDQKEFSRSAWLSDSLINSLADNLKLNQQSLLFLNRRGSARLIMCKVCGWQAACPRCDLPLTYHGDSHQMLCHTCGFTENTPTSCPVCRANDIVFQGIGTKSLFGEVSRLFPKARIMRFDGDSKKSERLETQYETILSGEVDILVGTQVLGKGLDLPRLGLVGIVLADSSLYFPDYTAEERTFQMITQVLGRISRGHIAGQAIIQTYHPESLLIEAAVKKDYEKFYETQIVERKLYDFPPFKYVLKLHCSRTTSKAAELAATKLADNLRRSVSKIKIIGPSPAFIERKNNQYHWQIIIMAAERTRLVSIIQNLPSNWYYDIDPSHLL